MKLQVLMVLLSLQKHCIRPSLAFMASATPRANNNKAAGIASARFSSPLADVQQQSLQQLKPDGSSTTKAAPLQVLYQDENFCVVAKPTPMHVHRPDFGSTDTTFVLQKARDQLGKRIHTPHRLDRGTSGCLVLAFSGDAAKVLHQALESNTATKVSS
jgi:23S rRNA-/tRNA-specific pseudouridylate synthase